jgi:CHAT domain-containing protein
MGGLRNLDAYRSVVIVPHGHLHYVPFHALHDGNCYLVERVPLSYAPSSAMYDLCRRRPSYTGGALVLGHSSGGKLPSAGREAALVADTLGTTALTEEAAKRSAIERRGVETGILHIAAHGHFRTDAPLFSSIELADGPLTTADVFSMHLRASLVTLSTCESGRFTLGGGDELVGMVRAFLYAGASTLLVSQFRVDDESTAELMQTFYSTLAKGASCAQALCTAQISQISTLTRKNGTAHPLLWAGFQVIGNDRSIRWRNPAQSRGAIRRDKSA